MLVKSWDLLRNSNLLCVETNYQKCQMYVTFVRPILEYASVVWYTCSISDTVKLKKVQLYAARIVTGLLILASRVFLY